MEDLKPSQANTSPLTPMAFIERAATAYSDCVSIIYNHTSYTWRHTHRRCLQLASSLSAANFRRHVISSILPNVPAMYELQFAVPMSGAILNNINTRLDARTISVILLHSQSSLVFVDLVHVDQIRDAVSMLPPDAPRPKLVLVEDSEVEGVDAATRGLFWRTYEEMVESGDPGFEWVRPVSDWDPMVLNYTSGTTSNPKGVVCCHRGMFVMTMGSLIDWGVPHEPVYLWTLPIFHVNGWSFVWGMAAVGGVNVCMRRLEPAVIFDAIEKHGVTHMCGAPVVLNMLANFKGKKRLPIKVNILTAGSPPPAAVLARAEELGFEIGHAYGMTETGGLVVSCAWRKKWNMFPLEKKAALKSRQGVKTLVLNKIDVVDPVNWRSVKRDGMQLGEIVVQGASLMLGYLKDAEATAKCITKEGWLITGDVGVIHPDGYLEIKDRSKDVIISGGENISSVEVESVIYSHPEVNEVAVVARADETWGESPCAFVSLKEGGFGMKEGGFGMKEGEIMEHCRRRMPHYMVPKTVVFLENLPKTSTGKVQKFLLREKAKSMSPVKTNLSSKM